MDNQTQALLSQLRDIRGLSDISDLWTASIWIGLALLTLIASGIWFWRKQKSNKPRTSKDLLTRLQALQDHQNPDIKAQLSEISEILRLCAVQYYGREVSAALEGEEWLSFIKSKEINGFDWIRDASIIINAPYMPPTQINKCDPSPIINAAERWVKNHV